MIHSLDKNQVCKAALNHFGTTKQMLKLAEECNELARAIVRHANGIGSMAEIEDELADVHIMAYQAAFVVGPKAVAERAKMKLERLQSTITTESIMKPGKVP